jgi:hypothetical protein
LHALPQEKFFKRKLVMLEAAFASRRKILVTVCASLLMALMLSTPQRVQAQDKDYEAQRKRAYELIDQGKFAEAQQIFEALAKEKPSDAPVMFGLGFTTLAVAKNIKDPEARRKGIRHG